jgi:hypothetical protein
VGEEASAAAASRLGGLALMLLPGALIVFFGFDAGGYFPAAPAVGAIVLTQILLVRILQARHPFAGFAPTTIAAIAALGGLAALTLASASWSHSLGRALVELNRAWLYLLVLVLYGSVSATHSHIRKLLWGLVLGCSIVCVAGLVTRVLPDVWRTAPDVANERLSYPVTYWNALGLLASLGIVLAFHLTCSAHERRVVRAAAAGVLPLLAATLFFTFSRGAIAAAAIGLLVYVLVARPRGLASGALAVVPATGVLIVVAYHANLLDTLNPTTPAATAQGHRVALVAGVCALAAAAIRLLLAVVLEPRLRRLRGVGRIGVRAKRGAVVASVALVVAAALALGVPHALAGDWERFIGGAAPHGAKGDLRARLTDPSNDGRTDLWRVALNGFVASPLHGSGAAMYQTLWDRKRPHFAYTINAHSLYLQAMAELGVGGLALLAALVGAVLVGLALRARGPGRPLYGALLAAGVVWAVHAGVDWDWEMPVVTVGFFAVAGLALSPRGRGPGAGRSAGDPAGWGRAGGPAGWAWGGRPTGWVPGHNGRMALALLCLGSVVLPVSMIGSQNHLGEAEHALYASDCTAATPAALASIGWLDVRPEPYEIVGFCDLRRGMPRLAIAAMREAVRHDPGSWETYYALAIAKAAAGVDPRGDARRALQMNPLEPLTREAARELDTPSSTAWVGRAAVVRAKALSSNDLSIVPS